jgi:hypothetical protein
MGTASPSGTRKARRWPALDVAASRNILPIVAQRRMQAVFSLALSAVVFVAAWLFARASLPLLLLAMAAGFVLAGAATRLRRFGEVYRQFEAVRADLDADQQAYVQGVRRGLRVESRAVGWRIAGGLVLALAVTGWALMSGARWWVLLACVLGLAYGRSSVRALGPPSAGFAGLTAAAAANGCRIALFRPFREETSALARNALLPILEGYGVVDVVGDPTFDQAPVEGMFGQEQAKDVPRPIHRFSEEEWRRRVREIIEDCDVAVLDVSIASPGVVWEVAQCYAALPDYRVMLVLSQTAVAARPVGDFVREFYALLGQHPEMPRDVHPYVFLFTPGAGQEEALVVDVHRKMTEIVQREG